jgi:Tfp pilus assembly protein PilF
MLMGRLTEARVRLEHSLQLDPSLFLSHMLLGDLFSSEAEYEQAISHYEEALRLMPDFKPAEEKLAAARSLAKR